MKIKKFNMRHLRKYESNYYPVYRTVSNIPIETDQTFWFISVGFEDDSKFLFSDEESASNFLLNIINDDREYWNKYDEFREPFINLDDAFEWREKKQFETDYEILEIKLSGKVELPEEIKKLRELKKYNL